MTKQPLPKVTIPRTWTTTQALCVIDFLHAVTDAIWDWYERPILDHMDRTDDESYDLQGPERPESSYKNDHTNDEDLPF